MDPELKIRKKELAINQCYWCKELKICVFEMQERGNWVPVCRECERGFQKIVTLKKKVAGIINSN